MAYRPYIANFFSHYSYIFRAARPWAYQLFIFSALFLEIGANDEELKNYHPVLKKILDDLTEIKN